jgi:competence CoiA-like predicted nuclease
MELQKNNKLEYKGKLETYQLYRGNTYTEYEKDNYNSYQNHLYKRALYGLSAFTQDELTTMCNKKKQRVNKVYMKGQNVINLYKQKVTNAYSNFIFKTLFPESPMTQFFIDAAETDVEFKNTLTFKDLNISKDQIVGVFITEGILPKNFYELDRDFNALPRLKKA